jgi:hypothetical protein
MYLKNQLVKFLSFSLVALTLGFVASLAGGIQGARAEGKTGGPTTSTTPQTIDCTKQVCEWQWEIRGPGFAVPVWVCHGICDSVGSARR